MGGGEGLEEEERKGGVEKAGGGDNVGGTVVSSGVQRLIRPSVVSVDVVQGAQQLLALQQVLAPL